MIAGLFALIGVGLFVATAVAWRRLPHVTERDGGVALDQPVGLRTCAGLGILAFVLVALAIAWYEWRVVPGPSERYGLPLTLTLCSLVIAPYGLTVLARGFGRLHLTPDGVTSHPTWGRRREVAWREIADVEVARQVLVSNRDAELIPLGIVAGWSPARTAEMVKFYAGHAGERAALATSAGLQRWLSAPDD